MAVATLTEVKAHLRIEHDDDDAVLNGCLAAAEDYMARIGCPVAADPVPPVLRIAAIMLIAAWYDGNPDLAGGRKVPAGFDALIASVREVQC